MLVVLEKQRTFFFVSSSVSCFLRCLGSVERSLLLIVLLPFPSTRRRPRNVSTPFVRNTGIDVMFLSVATAVGRTENDASYWQDGQGQTLNVLNIRSSGEVRRDTLDGERFFRRQVLRLPRTSHPAFLYWITSGTSRNAKLPLLSFSGC